VSQGGKAMPSIPIPGRSRQGNVSRLGQSSFLPGLCVLSLAGMIFGASGAGYFPYVDVDTASTLHRAEASNPTAVIGTIASLLSCVVFLIAVSRNILPAAISSVFVVVFCIYSASTLIWSNGDFLTLAAIFKSICFIVALRYCIVVLGPINFARVIVLTILAILIWSFILSLFDERFRVVTASSVGFNDELFGWRGAFSHKNHLSGFCMIAIWVSAMIWHNGQVQIFSVISIIIACILLWNSDGQSSQILTLFMGSIFAVFFFCDRVLNFPHEITIIAIFAILVLMLSAIYWFSREQFDWTFTGRTRIWLAYFNLAMERPIFGHGSGFDLKSDEIFGFLRQYAGGMTNAHNSFLAVLFLQGAVGLMLFIGWLASTTIEAVREATSRNSMVILLMLIASAALYGMFEAKVSPHIGASFAALAIMASLELQRSFGTSRASPAGRRTETSGRAVEKPASLSAQAGSGPS
jgi:O-antigen ligase